MHGRRCEAMQHGGGLSAKLFAKRDDLILFLVSLDWANGQSRTSHAQIAKRIDIGFTMGRGLQPGYLLTRPTIGSRVKAGSQSQESHLTTLRSSTKIE